MWFFNAVNLILTIESNWIDLKIKRLNQSLKIN